MAVFSRSQRGPHDCTEPASYREMVADAVGTAASLVALLAAGYGLLRFARRLWRHGPGSRRNTTTLLRQVACGVTREHVAALFGPPLLRMRLATHDVVVRSYRTRHAWLTTYDDDQDTVLAYAITVTDPNFSFESTAASAEELSVKVGQDRFNSTMVTDDWLLSIGARRASYTEAFYFGNPGGYQDYVLAYNDAGVGASPWPANLPPLAAGGRYSSPTTDPLTAEARTAVRANLKVNAFAVLGPNAPSELLKVLAPPGVDLDQVRLLPP